MRGEQQLKAGRLKAADCEGEGGERGKKVSGKEGPKSLGWKLLSDLPQSNNSWSLSELFPKITEWLPLIYFLNMARLSVPLVNFPMRLSAYNLFPFFLLEEKLYIHYFSWSVTLSHCSLDIVDSSHFVNTDDTKTADILAFLLEVSLLPRVNGVLTVLV